MTKKARESENCSLASKYKCIKNKASTNLANSILR